MAAAPRKIHTYDLVPDPGYSHLGYYTVDFFGDSLHFVDTIPKSYAISLINLHKRDVINGYITAENAKQTIKKTIENYYFYTSSMTIEDEDNDNIFKKQPVTKYYDHSRPINLRKIPVYYVSRINGEQVYQSKTWKFFSKDTNTWQISFTSEDSKIERWMSLDKFEEEFKKYDASNYAFIGEYTETLEKLHKIRVTKMTADEFFSQNRRIYKKDLWK